MKPCLCNGPGKDAGGRNVRYSVLILRTPAWPYVDPPDDHAYTTFRAFQQVYPWHIIDPGPEMVEYIARTHRDPRTFANWLPWTGI